MASLFEGEIRDLHFLIGMVWADKEGDRMIDVFGYRFGKQWVDNVGVRNWVYRNGVFSPDEEITCEDGLGVLGEERRLRRSCGGLSEYWQRAPDIASIGLPISGVDEFA